MGRHMVSVLAAFLCLSIHRDEEIAAKNISTKPVGQMYQAPVRRPVRTFGCWQRQCRHQIIICFYMGATTASKTQLWAAVWDGWMDKGLHGCWETAQPAGCSHNLSASELSSSTCYFLPPSITERLCFLHSQKLWDVNQVMLVPGLKPHIFF